MAARTCRSHVGVFGLVYLCGTLSWRGSQGVPGTAYSVSLDRQSIQGVSWLISALLARFEFVLQQLQQGIASQASPAVCQRDLHAD